MPSPDPTLLLADEHVLVDGVVHASNPKPLGRAQILASAGNLREEVVTVDGLGPVLCGELTGEDRAEVIEKQAAAYQENRLAVRDYQRTLLQKGILDPDSPVGHRAPLFAAADMGEVMRLGGSKVRELVEAVERLSGLGVAAVASAEGNSETTPSASSTSA